MNDRIDFDADLNGDYSTDPLDRVQSLFNGAAELLLMGQNGRIQVDQFAKRLNTDYRTAFTALVTLQRRGKDITIIL